MERAIAIHELVAYPPGPRRKARAGTIVCSATDVPPSPLHASTVSEVTLSPSTAERQGSEGSPRPPPYLTGVCLCANRCALLGRLRSLLVNANDSRLDPLWDHLVVAVLDVAVTAVCRVWPWSGSVGRGWFWSVRREDLPRDSPFVKEGVPVLTDYRCGALLSCLVDCFSATGARGRWERFFFNSRTFRERAGTTKGYLLLKDLVNLSIYGLFIL